MRTILNMATAFATILALFGEAAALGNFAPVKPLVHPRVTRPAIVPAPHVNRLTRKPDAPAREEAESEDESHTTRDRTAGNDSPTARTAPLRPETIAASEPAPEVVRRPMLRAPLPPSRPGGLAGDGPQHEAPTVAGGAPAAAPAGGPHIHDRLRDAFPHEAVTAMRDLNEWLAGRNAVDRDALGGGGDDGGLSNWRKRVGHDRRSSEGAIARATGGAFDARDFQAAAAGHAGEGGFQPPRRGSPSLGRPGRVGSGLRGNGPVSQDGAGDDGDGSNEVEVVSCGRNCVKYREHNADGSVTIGVDRWFPASGNTSDDGDLSNGTEGEGVMFTKTETRYSNGSRTRGETWGAFDAERRYTEIGDSQTPKGHEDENGTIHLPTVQIDEHGTDQPADPMYGSGGEPLLFECFDPVFPCFRPGVDARDTVSQPGRGGNEEIQPATPSVGERLRAVTQPVPGHTDGTGSGGGGGKHRVPCIRAKCNEPLPG